MKVEKPDVWKNIFSLKEFVPEMDFNTSLEYVSTIGLAMRDDDNVIINKNVI